MKEGLLIYREIPDCPAPDYVPEMSLEEEIRREVRVRNIIALTALIIHLLIVLLIIVTC